MGHRAGRRRNREQETDCMKLTSGPGTSGGAATPGQDAPGTKAVHAFVAEHVDEMVAQLVEWVRLRSLAGLPENDPDLLRSANWLAGALREVGFPTVEVWETEGAPSVYAEWCEAPGAPNRPRLQPPRRPRGEGRDLGAGGALRAGGPGRPGLGAWHLRRQGAGARAPVGSAGPPGDDRSERAGREPARDRRGRGGAGVAPPEGTPRGAAGPGAGGRRRALGHAALAGGRSGRLHPAAGRAQRLARGPRPPARRPQRSRPRPGAEPDHRALAAARPAPRRRGPCHPAGLLRRRSPAE